MKIKWHHKNNQKQKEKNEYTTDATNILKCAKL